jgi:hypothetical protein
MKIFWLVTILISSALLANEVKHIRSSDTSLLGIELMSSVDDVKAVFGIPEKIISNEFDVYDEIYRFKGLDIGFMEGKVEFIKITKPNWKLSNGFFIGKNFESNGVSTFIINESDCYLNVITKELVIIELRMFCAI